MFAMPKKGLSGLRNAEPGFIEPMYASIVRELPDGGLWTYEAKLDGYRCIAVRSCPADTLIDGEVIAIDDSRRVRPNKMEAQYGCLADSRRLSW
jgi:ATP-dependent DNA ligase